MMPWSPAPSSLLPDGVDALGDVGRLVVDVAIDRGLLPVEAVLLVADLADRVARDVRSAAPR